MRSRVALLACLIAALAAAPARASDGGAPPVGASLAAHTGGAALASTARRRGKPRAKPQPKRPAPRRAEPPAPGIAGVFPVRGSHSFGGPDARFGAARTGHRHQGQDIDAPAGTPVVAPVAGTIAWRAYQAGGAGYYLVEHGRDGRDYVFMHLKGGSLLVRPGDAVAAGGQLAEVGSTGESTGPHLHFEIWVGGWQTRTGHPIDPLPDLLRWDR